MLCINNNEKKLLAFITTLSLINPSIGFSIDNEYVKNYINTSNDEGKSEYSIYKHLAERIKGVD